MKKNLKLLLISILIVTIGHELTLGQLINSPQGSSTDVHHWVEQNFTQGKIPPFSFEYGGKRSEKFIKNWKFKAEKGNAVEPNSEVSVFTYSEPSGGLSVKCTLTLYTDFPSVEWLLNFSNISTKNSPIIEKVRKYCSS